MWLLCFSIKCHRIGDEIKHFKIFASYTNEGLPSFRISDHTFSRITDVTSYYKHHPLICKITNQSTFLTIPLTKADVHMCYMKTPAKPVQTRAVNIKENSMGIVNTRDNLPWSQLSRDTSSTNDTILQPRPLTIVPPKNKSCSSATIEKTVLHECADAGAKLNSQHECQHNNHLPASNTQQPLQEQRQAKAWHGSSMSSCSSAGSHQSMDGLNDLNNTSTTSKSHSQIQGRNKIKFVWREVTIEDSHPETGKAITQVYYYNRITKSSTWDKPTDFPGDALVKRDNVYIRVSQEKLRELVNTAVVQPNDININKISSDQAQPIELKRTDSSPSIGCSMQASNISISFSTNSASTSREISHVPLSHLSSSLPIDESTHTNSSTYSLHKCLPNPASVDSYDTTETPLSSVSTQLVSPALPSLTLTKQFHVRLSLYY